jgi:hypothetical protein
MKKNELLLEISRIHEMMGLNSNNRRTRGLRSLIMESLSRTIDDLIEGITKGTIKGADLTAAERKLLKELIQQSDELRRISDDLVDGLFTPAARKYLATKVTTSVDDMLTIFKNASNIAVKNTVTNIPQSVERSVDGIVAQLPDGANIGGKGMDLKTTLTNLKDKGPDFITDAETLDAYTEYFRKVSTDLADSSPQISKYFGELADDMEINLNARYGDVDTNLTTFANDIKTNGLVDEAGETIIEKGGDDVIGTADELGGTADELGGASSREEFRVFGSEADVLEAEQSVNKVKMELNLEKKLKKQLDNVYSDQGGVDGYLDDLLLKVSSGSLTKDDLQNKLIADLTNTIDEWKVSKGAKRREFSAKISAYGKLVKEGFDGTMDSAGKLLKAVSRKDISYLKIMLGVLAGGLTVGGAYTIYALWDKFDRYATEDQKCLGEKVTNFEALSDEDESKIAGLFPDGCNLTKTTQNSETGAEEACPAYTIPMSITQTEKDGEPGFWITYRDGTQAWYTYENPKQYPIRVCTSRLPLEEAKVAKIPATPPPPKTQTQTNGTFDELKAHLGDNYSKWVDGGYTFKQETNGNWGAYNKDGAKIREWKYTPNGAKKFELI